MLEKMLITGREVAEGIETIVSMHGCEMKNGNVYLRMEAALSASLL